MFDPAAPALHLARVRPDLLAVFAICQWARLDWLMPDVVISMPGAQKAALDFANMIQRPFANIVQERQYDTEAIHAEQVILVIGLQNSLAECQGAINRLSGTFLKRGYLLSLFP